VEDTTREIRELVYRTVMARTEEERFLMCADMFETAKHFAGARLPSDLSEHECKRAVFKEIYGFELPDTIRKGDRVNESMAATGNVFHAVFRRWTDQGLGPNEPLSKEFIIDGFQSIGLEPTNEILEIFTVLNGFDDDNVDDEFIQFWGFPKVIAEYKKGLDFVEFADYSIDCFRYAFQLGVQPAPIYIDYASVNIKIADSFADFFQKYLKDPASILG